MYFNLQLFRYVLKVINNDNSDDGNNDRYRQRMFDDI